MIGAHIKNNRTLSKIKLETIEDVFFDVLYVMFIDNKIPYPGRTWKNLEEPGTHKDVQIKNVTKKEKEEEEEDIRQ